MLLWSVWTPVRPSYIRGLPYFSDQFLRVRENVLRDVELLGGCRSRLDGRGEGHRGGLADLGEGGVHVGRGRHGPGVPVID